MADRPEPTAQVRFLLDGGWGKGESDRVPAYWRTFDRVLGEIDNPEELHTFVDRWNWDGGTKPILRALAHPLCDRGTGLMVYWRVDPIFYLKPGHRTRAEVETNLWPEAAVHWDLLRDLERRLAADDFRSARVPYDPTDDHGRDRTKQRFRKRPPRPVYEWHGDKPVQVGVEELPEEPEIDVRGSLPPFVFKPVVGRGSPDGT